MSLDQLFFQAKCLHPILQCKIQRLAEASGGGGCSRPFSGGMDRGSLSPAMAAAEGPVETPMGSSGLVFRKARGPRGERHTEGILWGSIKSVNRAIEKAIRVYKQVRTYPMWNE